MQGKNSGKKARKGTAQDESPREQRRKLPPLAAKNESQGNLMTLIDSRDIVFSVGPAGTGKTYISSTMAAERLLNRTIEKVIITRPMLACDEDIGFLPGDENDKYHPWVSPMIDVLDKRLGSGFLKYLLDNKAIRAQPLMMMRGSSFEDSVVILDEAQNTTPEQMKMFLTRIGENCTMIINGDLEQSDLKDRDGNHRRNGLEDALFRIRHLSRVGVAEFTEDDIVRHGIIKQILAQY